MKHAFRFFVGLLLACGLWMLGYLEPLASALLQDQGVRKVQFEVLEDSEIEVSVDGVLATKEPLESGSSQFWIGQDIILRLDHSAPISVTLDGHFLGKLDASGEVGKWRWQANLHDVAPSAPTAPPSSATPTTPIFATTAISPTPVISSTPTISPTMPIFPTPSISPTAPISPTPPISSTAPISPTTPISPTAPSQDSLVNRMTHIAKNAPPDSPYHQKTWLTYYGRPNIGVMGILGEYSINDLIPILWQQANAYDEANGTDLGVMPAFHLVYGMATKAPGEDNDYLAFLTDEVVMEYIEAAQQEGVGVILDIQIGALSPVDALRYGFPFLQHDNVHLAIDPEFAMSHPNQSRPGNPYGFVTAEQVNEAQTAMRDYMNANNIQGSRILLVHQFLDSMIVNKEQLARFPQIDLTITADGWGGPKAKIEKYNGFMSQDTLFAGFKLFYGWDNPLMTERQTLGIDAHDGVQMNITPNLIIYQ